MAKIAILVKKGIKSDVNRKILADSNAFSRISFIFNLGRNTCMRANKNEAKMDDLAWQAMIVSLFRQSERQTLNLIISITGCSTDDAPMLIKNIFHLIRRGIIYIPEARLKIFYESPELVDVYLIKDFDEAMKELAQELSKLRIETERLTKLKNIPQKVLIDLRNYAAGKYIENVR